MKPNAVFSNQVIRNGNSDGQSNTSLPAPSRFNGNQDESNRAIQSLNSRFAAGETEREKNLPIFCGKLLSSNRLEVARQSPSRWK